MKLFWSLFLWPCLVFGQAGLFSDPAWIAGGANTSPAPPAMFPTNIPNQASLGWWPIDTYATNGDASIWIVDQWTNGWTLTNNTASKYPTLSTATLNGHKVLQFASGKWLSNANITNKGNASGIGTIALTVAITNNGGGSQYLLSSCSSSSYRWGIDYGSPDVFDLYQGSFVQYVSLITNKYQTIVCVFNGAGSSQVYTNGVIGANAGTAGSKNLSGWMLNGLTDGTLGSSMALADIAFYATAFDSTGVSNYNYWSTNYFKFTQP